MSVTARNAAAADAAGEESDDDDAEGAAAVADTSSAATIDAAAMNAAENLHNLRLLFGVEAYRVTAYCSEHDKKCGCNNSSGSRLYGATALLVIDVLSELLGHAGEVAGVDPGGDTFSMPSRESFSPILPVIMARNSAKSMVPLPSPSMETIFLSSSFLTSKPKGAHDSLELTHVNLAGCISMPKPVASASIRSVVV